VLYVLHVLHVLRVLRVLRVFVSCSFYYQFLPLAKLSVVRIKPIKKALPMNLNLLSPVSFPDFDPVK